jgi:hypothetical protein
MNELKKLFSNIDIPEPSQGFEQRIIDSSFAQSKAQSNAQIIRRFGMVASVAIVLFITALSMSDSSTPDYYYLLLDDEIVTETDIYGDFSY